MSLSPNSVVVTGANRGIGLEFIKQLLKLPTPPANVIAACRSPDSAKDLQELAKEYKSLSIIRIDHDDLSCLDEAVKKVGQLAPKGLNLLINNAGVMTTENLDNAKPDEMMRLFQVNAVGPLMVTKAFLPLLRKASPDSLDINKAAVVNISTGIASIGDNGSGGIYAYRASKAALNMISKSLSLDLRKDNILVNALLPGWVQTDLGGSRAPLTVADSVQKMCNVMATWRGESCTGKFYSYKGTEVPW